MRDVSMLEPATLDSLEVLHPNQRLLVRDRVNQNFWINAEFEEYYLGQLEYNGTGRIVAITLEKPQFVTLSLSSFTDCVKRKIHANDWARNIEAYWD